MECLKEEMREIFFEWKEKLTEPERMALYEYSKYSSDEINGALEDSLLSDPEFGSCPGDLELQSLIKLIDSSLVKFTSQKPISVYRTEIHDSKKTADKLKEFLEGTRRIEYKRFVSTSFTIEAGKEIMRSLKAKYGDSVYLFIKAIIPKGKNMGYLCKELSAMDDGEDEILIARNITLEIDKVSINTNNTVIVEGYFS